MVRITEQLVRKRSEHNELVISTLEELSLHQEDIERIEHIQNWCRDLRILLLQGNLIAKIENLHKLKKLEYLNLSLNNIEVIENLERLESLNKLDLTMNFIGNLQSVENLRENHNLRELILTGNYCTEFKGYRDFVIATLPQLAELDGVSIKRTDQIIANRAYSECRKAIVQQQIEQQIKRDEQKKRVLDEQKRDIELTTGLTEDEINERFWQKKSEHCPETRVQIAHQNQRNRPRDVEVKKEKRKRRLFADDGRPFNLNEAKISFSFEDLSDRFILDLHVYKYLETSLIDVDVQPNYIRVKIKEKVLQLALTEEIRTDDSTSQRSLATGHLLITMPKLNIIRRPEKKSVAEVPTQLQNVKSVKNVDSVDYKHIVTDDKRTDVIDESEIPPLC